VPTVLADSTSSSAADRLVWPSATSRATRRSIGVNASHPDSGRACTAAHFRRRTPAACNTACTLVAGAAAPNSVKEARALSRAATAVLRSPPASSTRP
jgi:hypothetical protein